MEITPQDVLTQLEGAQIVDVRETEELVEGMIPGARHIPLGDLPHSHGLLNRAVPIIAVCRSGRRSAAAAGQLTAAGFVAHTMSGGMIEWQAEGLPTISNAAG